MSAYRSAEPIHPNQTINVVQHGGEPRKRVNHLLHLIVSLLTAGIWLPFWFLIWVFRK